MSAPGEVQSKIYLDNFQGTNTFITRDGSFDTITQHLSTKGKLAIVGPAEAGKSITAIQYCSKKMTKYKTCVYINATDRESLYKDYHKFAWLQEVVPTKSNLSAIDLAAKVNQCIEKNGPFLFLFDNVTNEEDIVPFLPPLPCHAIITSRRSITLPDIPNVAYGPPTRKEAVAYIKKNLNGPFERAEELAEKLGDSLSKLSKVKEFNKSGSIATFLDHRFEEFSKTHLPQIVPTPIALPIAASQLPLMPQEKSLHFPTFTHVSESLKNDHPAAQHIHMNVVCINDDSIITSGNDNVQPVLLSVDKKTSKEQWKLKIDTLFPALPVEPTLFYIPTKQGILLLRPDGTSPTIGFLIDPKSGEVSQKITLPAALQKNEKPMIHITPSGICYFAYSKEKKRVLSVLDLESQESMPRFEKPTPSGVFQPLGEYVCFKDIVGHATIFDKEGNEYKIPNCEHLQLKNGKLFSLEDECLVASRAITEADHLDIQESSKKQVKIDDDQLRFIDVCADGTCICTSGGKNKTLLFVDIDTQQIVRSEHEVSNLGHIFVDTKTSTVWTWDPSSRMLWKHTKERDEQLGVVTGGSNTIIAYVDTEERVYFSHS